MSAESRALPGGGGLCWEVGRLTAASWQRAEILPGNG